MTTDELRLEAQVALGELMQEQQFPFKLEAHKLSFEGSSRYTIHFYDSRLYSITVTWEEGQSFKEIVRAAVLERISRMTGTLNMKKR